MALQDEILFETQTFNEETTGYGAPQGLVAGRIYKHGKWTAAETTILVECKRRDWEKHGPGANRRTLMSTAAERWSAMEEEMAKRGVLRSKNQIQEKWEQLSADFKKVFYYERRIPSGRRSYFQMNPQERRESTSPKFPKCLLDEGVYKALCQWFPQKSQAVDPGNLPIDSSRRPSNRGSPVEEGQSSQDGGGDQSSDIHNTKKRRLSAKVSEEAISAMENNRKEMVNAMFTGQDREDVRHRESIELEKERVHREDTRHREILDLERERLVHTTDLGRGYIKALLSIGEGLKTIGEAMKKPGN